MNLSHAELVAAGARYLRTRIKCGIVVTELVTTAGETPDVLGWRLGGNLSYLLECKRTRADFFRDAAKGVSPMERAGVYKYYLTPPGLIVKPELPMGWGLLETDGGTVVEVVGAPGGGRNRRNEISLLYSIVMRLQGASPKPVKATVVINAQASDSEPNAPDAPAPESGNGRPQPAEPARE